MEFPLLEACPPAYSFVDIDTIMPVCTAVFDTFQPLSCDVLPSIIHKLNRTTCGLDPFPTILLMSHLSSIINIILRIVNFCFSSGYFPASCKSAIISFFDQFLNFDDHITAICRSTHFHIRNICKIRNLLSYDACSTIIHALISCRLDYCNYIMYNVTKSKTDLLQRLQNQCARILTKSPRREHITPVLKKLHWLKIQDRIIYKMLMFTYKSYYNMAPPYLCELINKRKSCEYSLRN